MSQKKKKKSFWSHRSPSASAYCHEIKSSTLQGKGSLATSVNDTKKTTLKQNNGVNPARQKGKIHLCFAGAWRTETREGKTNELSCKATDVSIVCWSCMPQLLKEDVQLHTCSKQSPKSKFNSVCFVNRCPHTNTFQNIWHTGKQKKDRLRPRKGQNEHYRSYLKEKKKKTF